MLSLLEVMVASLGEMIKKIAPLLLVGGTLVFNSVSEDSRNQFEKAIDDNGLKLEQVIRLTVDEHNPIDTLKAIKR